MTVSSVNARKLIKEHYGYAVENGVQLCSTDSYSTADLSYVPQAILQVNQGCSSPVYQAKISEGERVLDLGCGAGLDVFIAAKLVGSKGYVIGVDMLPEMLKLATDHMTEVAKNLGFDSPNTEFKKGYIESIPVPDNSQDVVLSNCVINLSTDKEAVFREIYRVLKPGGRFVIADVFSHEPVPMYIKYDEDLYSKCLGGVLDTKSGLSLIRGTGFRGIELVNTSGYSKVDATYFLSLTISGHKPNYQHQLEEEYAMYLGPFSQVQDELGNAYVRGVPTRISKEQSILLQVPAYTSCFQLGQTPQSFTNSEQSFLGQPSEKTCVYQGDYIVLVGPFTTVSDDDNHSFVIGESTEICEKTLKTLNHPLIQSCFLIHSRASQPKNPQEVQCGTGCC